jgi:glycosyltransferase involved in cell wall biosynthesis
MSSSLHPNPYTLHPALPVACVSVSAALGGSEWVLLDFVTRAARFGVEPVVVLPKSGPLEDACREGGVPVTVAPADDEFLELSQRAMLSPAGLARFAHGAWRWSRAIATELNRLASGPEGRPAILYSNGFKAHLACATLPGYAKAWHLHEFPPARLGVVWRLLAGALPDVAIANSASVARAWRLAGFDEPTAVMNGVDLDRFTPAARTYWIHDLLDLPHNVRLIGMPAVFARWKGHLLVVEAFERAAAQLDAHLVLVGGPIYDTVVERGYAEELAHRVRRSSQSGAAAPMPLSDRIHFVRFQTEPWHLYPEFDLVVHFSTRPEPFGRVLVEAMACGVPVIAAAGGGPSEIVLDKVTGWLVEPGNVAQLADAMRAALASDLGPIGTAARAEAERRFSAERFASEVARVLRSIPARKRS